MKRSLSFALTLDDESWTEGRGWRTMDCQARTLGISSEWGLTRLAIDAEAYGLRPEALP